MASLFPRQEHAEALFRKILQSEWAQERLYETFQLEEEKESLLQENMASVFPHALLQAYENQDLSALLIVLCGNTMFDLLRTAYLIPNRFGGKQGDNPRLLTTEDGVLLDEYRGEVSDRAMRKFNDIRVSHTCVPRSALYLADGCQMKHSYDENMRVQEVLTTERRGILVLYALPNTVEQGLTEAEAYNIVWDAFTEIQEKCSTSLVYYGQDTGYKRQQGYDELGVLLPLKEFEAHILRHLEQVDRIALRCREEMMRQAGSDSLLL